MRSKQEPKNSFTKAGKRILNLAIFSVVVGLAVFYLGSLYMGKVLGDLLTAGH